MSTRLSLGLCMGLAIAAASPVAMAASPITLTLFQSGDIGDPGYAAFLKLVESFEAANPGIKIKHDTLSHDAYHNKLQAMAIAGQLPDLIQLWPGKRTSYVTDAGLVKDLRPLLGDRTKEYAPLAMVPQGPKGELWELPQHITVTHIVFANDRLLKELELTYPATFDEFVAQAKKISAAGYKPLVVGNKSEWVLESCLFSTLVEREGGTDWFKAAKKGKGAGFTDPPFVAALQDIKRLQDDKVFEDGVNLVSREQATADFANERAVYMIEGDWKVVEFDRALTDAQKQYVSLHALPALKGEKGQPGSVSGVAGVGFGINAKIDPAKADAAWKFVDFSAGPVGAKIKLESGNIPSYLGKTDAVVPPMPAKLVKFAEGRPVSFVLDDQMDAEGMGLLNPGLQQIILGDKTPEELAKDYEGWVAQHDSSRR
jgi:raffinose/stachyose/melibiose transport system substrate-binding protein